MLIADPPREGHSIGVGGKEGEQGAVNTTATLSIAGAGVQDDAGCGTRQLTANQRTTTYSRQPPSATMSA